MTKEAKSDIEKKQRQQSGRHRLLTHVSSIAAITLNSLKNSPMAVSTGIFL
jgi:hypothetical protein